MQRERLGSRLGFILLSAGCAIGIGNVWKFPYITGLYGGGAFVLIYFLCLIIIGVPVLTMEFAVGRASQKSPVRLYQKLEPEGSKWHLHGYAALAGNYLLMMFYTSVAGWMLQYFVKTASGQFEGADAAGVETIFVKMLGEPVSMMIFMGIVVALGGLVCSRGLQNGLEKITKFMMLALLAIMVVLAVNSILLDGGAEGLKFYLLPDFDRMTELGVGKVIVGAMNQAFFTLSLGIAAMEIFGSYTSKSHTLPGEAVRICALDTFVALMAGTIIFPACFSFGIEPNHGPSLIFQTLPNVFVNMAGGRLWGALFFLFMIFASFSTVIAVLENILAICMDTFGWSRKKASVIGCILLLILSLPCVFGYNIWSNVHLIGGRDILDTEDFIVSNLLLPIGSLVYLLFCVSKWGWGFDKYIAEANEGQGIKFSPKLKLYFQWILPILILIILIQGLI